jgi:hypothetical protein
MTATKRISNNKERAKKGLPPHIPADQITTEMRRAWSAQGGRTNSDPGSLIGRLTRALPRLTAEQRQSLIALADAARAITGPAGAGDPS